MAHAKNAASFKHFKITLRIVVLTSGVRCLCVSLREVENKASCLKLTGDDGWSHCSAYNNSCQALGWACDPGPLTVAGGGDGNGSRSSQLPGSALTFPPCHPGPNILWQKVWFFFPLVASEISVYDILRRETLFWFCAGPQPFGYFTFLSCMRRPKFQILITCFFSVSQIWNSLICTTESHQRTFKN